MNKRYRCGWCNIRGHQENHCWVKADKRMAADEYDRLAAILVSHDKRDRVPDLRRDVARALRTVAK